MTIVVRLATAAGRIGPKDNAVQETIDTFVQLVVVDDMDLTRADQARTALHTLIRLLFEQNLTQ